MSKIMAPVEVEAHPMNGGDTLHSYAKNSVIQGRATDDTKQLVNVAIMDKLDIPNFANTKTISIADLGCSIGPNTFFAVQNIIESIELKYKTHDKPIEFQVLFNDHTLNDFNKLFKSLPPNRNYYAVGVPGSFHGRLFPTASLHFVYSSYALHWLSKLPKQVMDENSLAFNKGKVIHSNGGDEVVRAYEQQFEQDMDSFLDARAKEIVCGGLMSLFFPGRQDGNNSHSESSLNLSFELLGSCLMDMVQKGIISEEKVDSFNIPVYAISPQEVEEAVKRNGGFDIEKLELVPRRKHVQGQDVRFVAKMISSHVRAGVEELIKQHFGEEMDMDHLFDLYTNKVEDSSIITKMEFRIFVLLKRNNSTI